METYIFTVLASPLLALFQGGGSALFAGVAVVFWIILIILAIALFLAPFKLYSIHNEIKRTNQLIEWSTKEIVGALSKR